MGKVDWVIHMVVGDYGLGGIVNSHTHGMDNYNHMDFQLVLPLGKEQTMSLLNTICFEVQNGKRFAPGYYQSETVYSCAFRLELFCETGRSVLRLIFPDPNMYFPEEFDCEHPYKYQTCRAFEDADCWS